MTSMMADSVSFGVGYRLLQCCCPSCVSLSDHWQSPATPGLRCLPGEEEWTSLADGRPLPSQRQEEPSPQFPRLDSRGLCLSPIDIIMEPQLGSPIQCRLPPMHTHSSCSSSHTPPPAPSPIALDPCQPPPTQATRWAPETLPPTHGKRLPMCSSFHWGWRAGGCTLDLGLANRGLGWGVNMPQFPP